MVEFRTSEKFEDQRRQDLAEAAGRDRDARIQGLSLESGRRQEPAALDTYYVDTNECGPMVLDG